MVSANPPRASLEPEALGCAALFAQAFTLYLFALRLLAPPSEHNWTLADPILLLGPREAVLWSVPLLGLTAAIGWNRRALPTRVALGHAARHGLLGALVAIVVITLLRTLHGPTLPAFVPAEENAGPGLLLSMSAGYGEEVLFRLALLPALYLGLARAAPRAAGPLAIVLTALGFALLHAAGSSEWSTPYFITRFVFPGCVMSAAALYVSPSFVIVAHCTAHLLMPIVFR